MKRSGLQMSDGALHRYFLNNGDKRLHKWVHYFNIYERHFARFRDKSPVILEVGVFGGGSPAMWKNYFGKGSKILGIDINPECKNYESQDIEIFIGSQSDVRTIESVLRKYPNIDIVLDDGSHMMAYMLATFEFLYDKIDKNGVYVVEDTHTCYWPEYDGGLKAPGSFMEFTKSKLDEINAAHSRGAVPISLFTRSTDSVTVYDSVVVFERRPQGTRQAPITGPMDA